MQASSLQVGEHISRWRIFLALIQKLIIPNICLLKKPIIGNIDSCFLHHSKGCLMSFTSIWYLWNINSSQLTQHILGFVIGLYNYILIKKGHMRLVTSESLNLHHFTHLVARDIYMQSLVILTIRIFLFFYNNEIPYHH